MSTTSLAHLTELQRQAFLEGLREVVQRQAFQEGFLEACDEEEVSVEEALDAALWLLIVRDYTPVQAFPVVQDLEWVEPRDLTFVRENSQLAPPMEMKDAA